LGLLPLGFPAAGLDQARFRVFCLSWTVATGAVAEPLGSLVIRDRGLTLKGDLEHFF
jgi:hypothetical protein